MKLALVSMVVLVALLACELVDASSRSDSLAWRQFKQQHAKVYSTQEEEARRFAIFIANKQLIERHNANASASYTMALNHMSDWTAEEYARLNGARPPVGQLDVISEQELDRILGSTRDAPLPDEFDWRKIKGRVSDIKNQKDCGSCWAFATTGLLEGQELGKNITKLVPLSEQELVDCVDICHGCDGGWMSLALLSISSYVHGVESEVDYPYQGIADECHKNATKFLPLKVGGYKMLTPKNEQLLKRTVVNYGPVAVAFEATDKFQYYNYGVFDDNVCKPDQPNHAVLVIGYGTDPHVGDYWLVKNSWGTGWGEKGYFRIKAGVNMCGIADYGTIATF